MLIISPGEWLIKLSGKSLVLLCLALCLCFSVRPTTAGDTSFDLETATIEDISRAIDKGALTSEQLVRLSLARSLVPRTGDSPAALR